MSRYRLGVLCCLGTGEYFIARALQLAGYEFGHEALRPDGMIHHMLADSRLFEVPCPKYHGELVTAHYSDFSDLLHVVRDPLTAIPAIVMARARGILLSDQMDTIELMTTATRSQHPYEFALRYWVEWNVLCGRIAKRFAHVETFEVSDAFPDSMAMRPLGRDYPTTDFEVTWPDLKDHVPEDYFYASMQAADAYGYTVIS